MTHFKTLSGERSWLSRSMLVEKMDPGLIGPEVDRETFDRERVKARKAGKLVEFYERSTLSLLYPNYVEGDEVWEYNDLRPLSGSAGFVLIRGDVAVAVLVTARS